MSPNVALSGTETVAVIRDVVVIVFLILGFFVLFVGSVLGVLLYRRVSKTIDQAEHSISRMEAVLSSIQESVVAISSVAGSIRPALSTGLGVSTVFRAFRTVLGLGRK